VDFDEEDEDLKLDSRINISINKRNDIRDLSKILAPVDGFILTGALGLLYFILNNRQVRVATVIPDLNWVTLNWVIDLLLLTSVLMAGSIVSSIQSVNVRTQKPILTKIQYIDDLNAIYTQEYKWAHFSVVLLLFGIGAFIVAMIVFSWNYLTTAPG
jgi:hypothetical protein